MWTAICATLISSSDSALGNVCCRHADSLNATLQHQSLSAAEGQSLAAMTVTTLTSIRTDKVFDSVLGSHQEEGSIPPGAITTFTTAQQGSC